MIGRVVLTVALVWFLTAAGGSVDRDGLPGIVGRDDRVILDSATWPWAAVGRLNRAGVGFCTGTLVAPDLVLTAAHCLFDPQRRRWMKANDIHFVAGYRRGDYLAHSLAREILSADGVRFTANGGTVKPGDDWALVRLATAMTIAPIPVSPLQALAPSAGDGPQPRLLVAGYSRDRPHLLSLHEGCAIAERIAADRAFLHTCDATHGTSGAPLILRTGEGFFVVGVIEGFIRVDGVERGIAVPAEAFLEALDRLRAKPAKAP